MDPQHSAQDVLRCDLCETPVPPMYCDICHLHLCKACVGEHLADETKEHKVVPFRNKGSTIKCPKHSTKICELHCEQCDIPICAQCISSGEHLGHKAAEIMKFLTSKKEIIKEDLQELEKSIYPEYQKAASNIPVLKDNAKKHSQTLIKALREQGEVLHKEIDTVIQRMQSQIDDMGVQHLAAINKQNEAIKHTIIDIEQIILDLRQLLDSSEFCLVSEYKSRNEEFRSLPAQFHVTLPTFTPQDISTEQIHKQLGSLSKLAITTESQCESMKSSGAVIPPARPLIDQPRILADIKTKYGTNNRLCNVSCLSDNEFWTRGWDAFMTLYNFQGVLLKSVKSKSENMPHDIAVTLSGDFVYTDYDNRSINLVSNSQIQTLIRLCGWRPGGVCTTSSGDLLVTMRSDDKKQSKVVRYIGSTEKQSIQWDNNGQPLYTSISLMYLTENRNLNICVADNSAGAVVVVSAAGTLRFRYTGNPSTNKKSFKPWGITTDSQGRILTADCDNQSIHILDQAGHFLRYIDNCALQCPFGLCIDSKDNLFVTENQTGKVKKIQYCK